MAIDTSSFEHYSFDLWLTLIKSNSNFKQKRNALLQDFFCLDRRMEEITRTVRHYDVLCNHISEMTGKHVDRDHIYGLLLADLGFELGMMTKEHMDGFKAEVDLLFMKHKPILLDVNLKENLEAIVSKGKTISLLSNTAFLEGELLRKLLDHYELSELFSFQHYSDETGLSKPNPAAFERVYQEITKKKKLQRADVVHIGDNKRADYDGAISFGFNALLI